MTTEYSYQEEQSFPPWLQYSCIVIIMIVNIALYIGFQHSWSKPAVIISMLLILSTTGFLLLYCVFERMKIEITHDSLRIRYRIAPIKTRFLLSDIERTLESRFKMQIRWTGSFDSYKKYTMGRRQGVIIELQSGLSYFISTRQPQILLHTLRKAMTDE